MDQKQAQLMQHQLRHNTEDLHEFMKGLDGWESEIKRMDEALRTRKPILKEQQLPPVRNQAPPPRPKKKKRRRTKAAQPSTATTGSDRISSYDYSSWDRFDVDKACEEVDYQVHSSDEESEGGEGSSGDEQLEEDRRRQRAVLEKDKGNAYFKQGLYEQSVESYSRAMQLDPLSAVLPANRAMALIKLQRYAAAEQDCSSALLLDPSYTKAYHRRGLARTHLNQLPQAKEDFQAVLQYEAGNKMAKSEIAKLEKLMAEQGTSVAHSNQADPMNKSNRYVTAVERAPHLRSKKPLRRVRIEDIGQSMEDPIDRAGESNSHTTPTVTEHSTPSSGASAGDSKTSPESTAETTTSAQNTPDTPASAQDGQTSAMGHHHNTLDIANGVQDSLESSKCLQDTPEMAKSTQGLPESSQVSVARLRGRTAMPVGASGGLEQVPGVPSSSLQFQADWKRLKNSPKLRSQYFKSLPLQQYPTLLQQSLETEIFMDIITILHEDYVKCGTLSLEELEWLSKVKRFSVSIMFLSAKDKDRLQELFTDLNALNTAAGSSVLCGLAKLYCVNNL